jgi:hypothetical protein
MPPTPHKTVANSFFVLYYIYVYIQSTSPIFTLIPSFISSIHPLLQTPPPHRTYFTILSFIFNSKVSVQRVSWCISTVWIYCILVCSICSVTLPYQFTPTPYYSTAFCIYCHIIYLHRCNVFRYRLLSITIFWWDIFHQNMSFWVNDVSKDQEER